MCYRFFYDKIDSVVKICQGKKEEEIKSALKTSEPVKFLAIVRDLQVIKTDCLIDNIDRAFDLWQNGEFATHLTFDDFCEYLLPYKVCEVHTLDNWRKYLSAPEYGDLQYLSYSVHSNHSSFWAADKIKTVE